MLALVRFVARVTTSSMDTKAARLSKGGITFTALEWSFATVGAFVGGQITRSGEGLVTIFTFVRLCAGVRAKVTIECAFLCESLLANFTLKWLSTRMDGSNVIGKSRLLSELCLTLLALVRSMASMSSLVFDQTAFQVEPFRAVGTGKWLVPGVHSFVSFKC